MSRNLADPITDLQFQILDAIYFPEPLENILAETDERPHVVSAELREMVATGWVQVMAWNEQLQDYARTTVYDVGKLGEYRFLITKEGLLRHNGRR